MAGRPKRVFTDEEIQQIEQYARNNSLTQTIAVALNISVNTLKRHFGRKLTHWRAVGKVKLRDNLYKQAANSPQTAIFLAKNELGMTDKQVVEQIAPEQTALTPDEMKELKRLAGLATGIKISKQGA